MSIVTATPQRPSAGCAPALGHRRALDGIRGLAIAGVLLLHSTIWGDVPEILPGGNLGVAVFFVLSGYLITRLLLEEHRRKADIDLRAFYLRRAARLLPALLVLVPVYLIVFSRQLTPGELLLPVISTLLYLSSFVQSIWGAMGNLGFTWSLSVEEHFYALWPPMLRWLLGGASGRRRGLIGRVRRHPMALAAFTAVLIIVAAVGARIALAGSFRGREFAYFSTFTRLDALVVGCLAALASHCRQLRVPLAAGWGALLTIAWCYASPQFTIGSVALDLYGLPLCTVAAAVLVLAVVERPATRLSGLLSCRPLVHLGTISYGLYIWNLMPGQTFRVLEGRHPGPLGTLGCALVMLVIVEVSYHLIEQPFLRWARRRMTEGRDRARRPRRGLVALRLTPGRSLDGLRRQPLRHLVR